MKFAKKVAQTAIISTIVYIVVVGSARMINWYSDNFVYLPAVSSVQEGSGVIELITDSGEVYVVEVKR